MESSEDGIPLSRKACFTERGKARILSIRVLESCELLGETPRSPS
jgi:hypothetical protein